VEHGKPIPDQRVVIEGNRIQVMGDVNAVKMPRRAQVVNARGKYLIPGLWDMHVHLWVLPDVVYPLLLVNGVTGIRDVGTGVPLDTLRRWRQEILMGTRLGPPRQLFAGPMLDDGDPNNPNISTSCRLRCFHGVDPALAVGSPEHVRHIVDSLYAAGADFIKVHGLKSETYFAVVNEAHRLGIPFAGHLPYYLPQAVFAASDSGQRTIEHMDGLEECLNDSATVERCRPIAERHIRNETWDVLGPTWMVAMNSTLTERERRRRLRFWPDSITRDWQIPSDSALHRQGRKLPFHLEVAERAGLPILVGTDVGPPIQIGVPGFGLHDDLAIYVDGGLTPLAALRAVTLNPAKFLGATDSLGTVSPGKLADLVLLDGNPLIDIRNTTAIRAVVANGRYFDRAALDHVLRRLRLQVKVGAKPLRPTRP
jgi:imidazolonepropionase-like amidohydrolase